VIGLGIGCSDTGLTTTANDSGSVASTATSAVAIYSGMAFWSSASVAIGLYAVTLLLFNHGSVSLVCGFLGKIIDMVSGTCCLCSAPLARHRRAGLGCLRHLLRAQLRLHRPHLHRPFRVHGLLRDRPHRLLGHRPHHHGQRQRLRRLRCHLVPLCDSYDDASLFAIGFGNASHGTPYF
jgi:hypothetical protein